MLHDRFWRDRMGGEPAVIGSELVIDGIAMTVIGVMPAGVDTPEGARLFLPR